MPKSSHSRHRCNASSISLIDLPTGQAVIKRNMKRYSVLLLGMHENSLDSNEVEEAEQRLDDALCSLCGNQPVYRGLR